MDRALAPAASAHYDPRLTELSTLLAWHTCSSRPGTRTV